MKAFIGPRLILVLLLLVTSLGVAAIPAGLSGAGPAAEAAPRKDRPRKAAPRKRPRFKIVSRTFTNNAPIVIPDHGPSIPYPSTIRVGGLKRGSIRDVNVTIKGLSHTAASDLAIVLVAPGGQRSVVLMDLAGNSSDVTDITLIFDDQAAAFVPADSALQSGTFKPTFPFGAPSPATASLRMLNGLNPNGAWRLFVVDNFGADEGSIDGWSLRIRARVRR